MRDISARELKGHNILAVERFQDSTRWMVEFAVRKPRTPYGSPGDEVRLFLTEDGYRQALDAQRSQQIKIKRSKLSAMPTLSRGTSSTSSRRKSAATRKPAICQERNELCVPLETLKKPSANTANPSMTWKVPRSTR